jgi:hypothetical protein
MDIQLLRHLSTDLSIPMKKILPPSNTNFKSVFTILMVLIGLISSSYAREVKVVINASADEQYLKESAKKPVQTYHFIKGKYYPGAKRDNSLRELTFEEVAKTTAKYLAEQKFVPESDFKKGDLLIMITWGTTQLDPDYTELMGITDLGGGMNTVPDVTSDGSSTGQSADAAPTVDYEALAFYGSSGGAFHAGRNLRMLGYGKGLYSKEMSEFNKETLQQDLEEERYFIILNAFDLPYLRETKEYKEVWSCRISTRNRGTNFVAALDTMNAAAAPTFGRNLDQLKTDRFDTEANVQIGEIEVIGTEEDEPREIQ